MTDKGNSSKVGFPAVASKLAHPAWPPPRVAWYLTFVLVIAYVFSIVDRIIMGQLAPFLQADLGLSDTELGLIQGIGFAVCYTMFGLVFGWASDRFTRRTLAALGVLVWSVATVLCGFAVGFWSLAIFRIGVAIGEAALNPAAASLIPDVFEPKKRARAFGVYQMGAATGSLLAFLLSGIILVALESGEIISLPWVGELRPWQITFILLGIPGIAVALWLLSIPEPARREVAKEQTGSWADAVAFIRLHFKTISLLLVGMALVMMSVYGWLFWLATFFTRTYGWSVATTGIVFGLTGGITGLISAGGSGFVTEWLQRMGLRDAAPRTCAIGATGVSLFSTAAALMPGPVAAIVMLTLWKLFINLPTSAIMTSLNELAPNQLRGKIASIYIVMMGLFASGTGSLVVALMTDNLFSDHSAVRWSLALVSSLGAGTGAILMWLSLAPFRSSLVLVSGWRQA